MTAALAAAQVDTGDTAWVLVCAALVLLMTPGLALFYGGMVRSHSVLNMMLMSFVSMGTIGVVWVLWGYNETFGADVGAGLVGDPFRPFGAVMRQVLPVAGAGGGIPAAAFATFQAAFAMIAVALVSGAIAGRARFVTWSVFTVIWATCVYFPVAHWVFAVNGYAARAGGWIANDLHVVDFAGGTAIHINAGAAGLALALVLGRRHGFGTVTMRPHNLTLVMLGAGLLWFGWLGFDGGSALSAGSLAAGVWLNSVAAAAAGMLGWLVLEQVRDGRATSLGAASGVVAGLVAITPGCAALSPVGSIGLGALAGATCAWAVRLKHRLGFDDSVDVVGVHLVGGLLGTVAIGLLATRAGSPDGAAGVNGLLYGGGIGQLWRQAVAAVVVLAFSFTVTYAIGWLLQRTVGFRLTLQDELTGVDRVEHAESGYDLQHLLAAARSALDPPPAATAPGDDLAGPGRPPAADPVAEQGGCAR